ncbi:hypothetical protein ACI0X9_003258 [Cronobacter turicensis]
MKISSLLCIVFILAGCGKSPLPSDPQNSVNNQLKAEHENSPLKLSAFDILKQAGLMTKNEYTDAQFIPNSEEKMIVADVREAPCRMVFRFISTKSGSYWMPNQISCND